MKGNRERIATPLQFRTDVAVVWRSRSQLARLPKNMPSGRPLAITISRQKQRIGCAVVVQPATGAVFWGRRRERARRARVPLWLRDAVAGWVHQGKG